MEVFRGLLLPRLQVMSLRQAILSLPGVRSGTTVSARRKLLSAAIAAKWQLDRARLPLNEEHRELYGIIHRSSWKWLQDFPRLVHCRGFNDKIQWLKLFDQREEAVQCADKIAVRDYVKERTDDSLLVPVLQTCSRFEEIDFAALPKSFVIKVNNESGNVILVRDKAAMDMEKAEGLVNYCLRRVYGWNDGEWAYACIAPRIVVEEFIEPESKVPPADYKFHCVDGKVRWLQYIFDRGADTKEAIVDPDGRVTDIHFDHKMTHVPRFQKPAQWKRLKEVAEALAASWKYVRVDLYLVDDEVKFGELTLHPLAGTYRGEGQLQLGKLMDFDRSTFRPPIYRRVPRAPRPE